MMNAIRALLCVAVALSACPAIGATYELGQTGTQAGLSQVDLFRHYDPATRTQMASVWSEQTGNTPRLIDGSYWSQQVGPGSTARWDLDFTLDPNSAAIYTASRLELEYGGNHRPSSITVSYSTTGFDDLTKLVVNVSYGADSVVIPFPDLNTPIKYLRIEQDPGASGYIVMNSVRLFSGIDSVFDDETDGFNYMANPGNRYNYVTGGADTDFGVKYRLSGDPRLMFDNNIVSHAKPITGVKNFIVIPLEEVKSLWGVNLGFFNSQHWTGYEMYVSCADEMPVADPDADGYNLKRDWTLAHQNSSPAGAEFIWVEDKNGDLGMDAKWVYIVFRGVEGQGAMCEIELYVSPVPEPAAMTLLALGGLALLRRRK